jgi:branched-chain amino acid transport system permease protein
VSALFSGMGGALFVFYIGTASVGSLVDVAVGVQVIIGAVLGGRRTIVGGVLGAVFLIAAGEALRPFGTLSTFVVSLIALVVIMVAPGGLLGLVLHRGESE